MTACDRGKSFTFDNLFKSQAVWFPKLKILQKLKQHKWPLTSLKVIGNSIGHTWLPTPTSGTHTKFEVFMFTHYEYMKGEVKCFVFQGSPKVTGNVAIR